MMGGGGTGDRCGNEHAKNQTPRPHRRSLLCPLCRQSIVLGPWTALSINLQRPERRGIRRQRLVSSGEAARAQVVGDDARILVGAQASGIALRHRGRNRLVHVGDRQAAPLGFEGGTGVLVGTVAASALTLEHLGTTTGLCGGKDAVQRRV